MHLLEEKVDPSQADLDGLDGHGVALKTKIRQKKGKKKEGANPQFKQVVGLPNIVVPWGERHQQQPSSSSNPRNGLANG